MASTDQHLIELQKKRCFQERHFVFFHAPTYCYQYTADCNTSSPGLLGLLKATRCSVHSGVESVKLDNEPCHLYKTTRNMTHLCVVRILTVCSDLSSSVQHESEGESSLQQSVRVRLKKSLATFSFG